MVLGTLLAGGVTLSLAITMASTQSTKLISSTEDGGHTTLVKSSETDEQVPDLGLAVMLERIGITSSEERGQ